MISVIYLSCIYHMGNTGPSVCMNESLTGKYWNATNDQYATTLKPFLYFSVQNETKITSLTEAIRSKKSNGGIQKQTFVSHPRQNPLEGFSKIRIFWTPRTKVKFHFKEKKHKNGQLICLFPLQKRPVNTSQSPWETSIIYQRARCRPGCCCHWI